MPTPSAVSKASSGQKPHHMNESLSCQSIARLNASVLRAAQNEQLKPHTAVLHHLELTALQPLQCPFYEVLL